MMEVQRSFIDFPAEVWVHILSFIDDVHCLHCAVQTCQKLKVIFDRHQAPIVRSVLVNLLGEDCLPEATLVQRCKPLRLSDPKTAFEDTTEQILTDAENYAYEFLNNLQRPAIESTVWTLRDAIEIANLHQFTVLGLTEKFLVACQRTPFCDLRGSFERTPPSRREKMRVVRALYMYELFRRLFGCFRGWEISLEELSMMLFSKLSPWEIAQMACIHDFLARLITPGFNHVAKHDPLWGSHFMITFSADLADDEIQQLLSLGLEWIYVFSTLTHYKELERAVRKQGMGPALNPTYMHYMLLNITMNDELIPLLQGAQFFYDDGDSGPEEIWKLSCDSPAITEEPTIGVYEDLDWPYRRWGYVFWEQQRLSNLGFLQTPWRRGRMPEENPEAVPRALMEASWKMRQEKYGGWESGMRDTIGSAEPCPPPLCLRSGYPRSWLQTQELIRRS